MPSSSPPSGARRASSPSRDASPVVSIPADLVKVPFVQDFGRDPNTRYYPLEDGRGQRACWSVGSQTAEEFVRSSDLVGPGNVLFHTSVVTLFFPVGKSARSSEYFVSRRVAIRGSPTVARILRAVEDLAVKASAYHLRATSGGKPTEAEAREALRRVRVCHLMCRKVGGGNRVYVRTGWLDRGRA